MTPHAQLGDARAQKEAGNGAEADARGTYPGIYRHQINVCSVIKEQRFAFLKSQSRNSPSYDDIAHSEDWETNVVPAMPNPPHGVTC